MVNPLHKIMALRSELSYQVYRHLLLPSFAVAMTESNLTLILAFKVTLVQDRLNS